ncbi:MAG: Gfo/Idh/MocA family protein [Geminicoccaceae bacterium]
MVRILILGTGAMAAHHAKGFAAAEDAELVGAVDVDTGRLEAFCDTNRIGRCYASLDEALAWGGFDAVANVTPDNFHYPTTMKLLAAGKHVLCEKPLATDAVLAEHMAEEAEKRGLINMVNLRYRSAAAIQHAHKLVRDGVLGEIRHVAAAYQQSWLVGNHWGDWRTEQRWLWRLSQAHGSQGVLGDIGIHIVDFASHGADADIDTVSCQLQTFPKAEGDQIGEYALDANDSFIMNIMFDGGALGVIHASRYATGHANRLILKLHGTNGAIDVDLDKSWDQIDICAGDDVNTQTWRTIDCPPVPDLYARFVRAVRDGKADQPDFRRAAHMQQVLDQAILSDATGSLHRVKPAYRTAGEMQQMLAHTLAETSVTPHEPF